MYKSCTTSFNVYLSSDTGFTVTHVGLLLQHGLMGCTVIRPIVECAMEICESRYRYCLCSRVADAGTVGWSVALFTASRAHGRTLNSRSTCLPSSTVPHMAGAMTATRQPTVAACAGSCSGWKAASFCLAESGEDAYRPIVNRAINTHTLCSRRRP